MSVEITDEMVEAGYDQTSGGREAVRRVLQAARAVDPLCAEVERLQENLSLLTKINDHLRADAIRTARRHAVAQDNIHNLITGWETPSEDALNAAARVEYEQVTRAFGNEPSWETDFASQRHYRDHVDPATKAAFKVASNEFLLLYCPPAQREALRSALDEEGRKR